MAHFIARPIRRFLANPFFKYGLILIGLLIAVLGLFPGVRAGLFGADEFMPHATCYLRNPKIILLHVSSDLLIGLAYVSISATLAYLVQRASAGIPFHWMFLAFGLFIITCGFTHFMEVWTVWSAVYWLAGWIKLICAVASVATAVALYPLVPKIFALVREVRMSERRRLELQQANEELQAFAYSVSHDLRAPLRAIQGMSTALTEDYAKHLEPGAREYLDRIIGASKRMDALVRDLLEYSRISRSAFEMAPVDLKTVLEEAQSLVGADIEQAGAEVVLMGSMPHVQANSRLLTQVLTNLLGNAIKFVAPGVKPLVHVSVESSGPLVKIAVRDNGIGIDPQYHGKIFRMFERLHSVQQYAGTGIGLAIVQRAMSQMNGSVSVESTPGKGSCFWLELPAAAQSEDSEKQFKRVATDGAQPVR